VVNVDALFAELEHNGVVNLPDWEKRLLISEEAHLVLAVHMQVDGRQEDSLDAKMCVCV
jgi:adenylosuccinate synthase